MPGAVMKGTEFAVKNGFRRRLDNESYREYVFAAQLFSGEDAEGLIWLADTASKAALLPASVDSAQIDSATGHAKDLRTKSPNELFQVHRG